MNQKLNILIVEDSPSFAIELDLLISKIGYTVQGLIDNAEEALEAINKEAPDLILLDIELKGQMTGIDLSKEISHLDIPIIFITSFKDETHYNDAKNSKMVAYLMKPLSGFSLRVGLETAIVSAFSKNNKEQVDFFVKDYLFFIKEGIYHKIKASKINYIKSSDNYCEVFTTSNNQFTVRSTITNFINVILPENLFVRIHRQYIVNLGKINSIDNENSTISLGSSELPISRSYKKELLYRIDPISHR